MEKVKKALCLRKNPKINVVMKKIGGMKKHTIGKKHVLDGASTN
jgi:hypothetical protein